jgi:hypothetical protein
MQSQRIQMQLQSKRRGPSGHRLLFRMHGISLVIEAILGGIDIILRSLLLHSLPLDHFHPYIFSWFSLQIHSIMVKLLEIRFGNQPRRSITTPSLRTKLRIWFPFLLGGNLSDVDGSTRPRAQRMDILVDTKPRLVPKAFSKCIVLTMMRPSLE